MMPSTISLNAVRVVFLCTTCLLGMLVALGFGSEAYMGGIVGFCFGASIIALELLLKNFTLFAVFVPTGFPIKAFPLSI